MFIFLYFLGLNLWKHGVHICGHQNLGSVANSADTMVIKKKIKILLVY